jgi:hypothetical protein
MIYCVVPRELIEADPTLFDRLEAYYADNPAVTVIVDRRLGPDRRRGRESDFPAEHRVVRDRRRARAAGTFAETDVPDP